MTSLETEAVIAAAPAPSPPLSWQHTLTLKFGRTLTEAEWREVVEAVRAVPHVQALEANAIPAQQIRWCKPDESGGADV